MINIHTPGWFPQLCRQHGVSCPQVFVETGTYKGDGIERVKTDFREVHSIELKEEFVIEARARFADDPRIHVHHGDSAEVLKVLGNTLNEPVLFYLDAHFSGGATAFGSPEDKGCPLLRELKAISERSPASGGASGDIVVVDDMRLMGKAALSGVKGDEIYPETFFDFEHVSMENIKKAWGKPARYEMCKDIDRLVILPLA